MNRVIYLRICFAALMLIRAFTLSGLQLNDQNRLRVNNLAFSVQLMGEQRTSDFSYAPLSFSAQPLVYQDSLAIVYSAADMNLRLSFIPRTDLGVTAWQIKATADFSSDIYIRQLYLQLDFDNPTQLDVFKGIDAIQGRNQDLNRNITPYSDKVIQYRSPYGSLWLAASNYAGCYGVEGLTANRIQLYDHSLHFYRRFRPSTQAADLPRDTMFKPAGSSHSWSLLLFEEPPFLLSLSRWPAGKDAALCITNDADSESNNRLAAMYLGSSDPASPKYLTSGLIAHGIKVSNTVFGANQPEMQAMWHTIKDAGNSIAYHTYAATADPAGSNSQALLNDLVPFNIRLWIDHNVPQNPEDLAWNGLDPVSENYVADVLNQSNIDYAWFNDTPPTNPFNAFDDPWRLPHLIYEATALTKPVWFFGRTRTEVWEYTNGNYQIDMKNVLTAQNIEKLLTDRGLHISYTHFGASWTGVLPFFEITPEGAYEIRDEVEEMLQMLQFYRDYRGLWIDTVENIFDRLLAIEKVQVVSVTATNNENEYLLTLQNNSGFNLSDLSLSCLGVEQNIPGFPAGSVFQLLVNKTADSSYLIPQSLFALSYQNGMLRIEDKTAILRPRDEIQVFNLRGQHLKTYSPVTESQVVFVPLQNVASGVYFVKVEQQGKTAYTGKLIVLK